MQRRKPLKPQNEEPKVKRVRVSFNAKRVVNYNSVGLDVSVEMDLDETLQNTLEDGFPSVANQLRDAVEERLDAYMADME